MSEKEKNKLIERAKLAEAVVRYEDMASFMSLAIKCGFPLNKEEIDLFAVAFKQTADDRRSLLESINFTEMRETSEINLQRISIFKRNIEAELQKICYNALDLLDDWLIPTCNSTELRILCNKIKGDYYRYLVPVISEDKKKDILVKAYNAYNEAYEMSKVSLNAAHPIRLGVALNFSVCCHEVLNNPEKAVEIAKEATDGAKKDQESVTPDTLVETSVNFQFIRDNLMLWKVPLSSGHEDISGNISNEINRSTSTVSHTAVKSETNYTEDKYSSSSNNETSNTTSDTTKCERVRFNCSASKDNAIEIEEFVGNVGDDCISKMFSLLAKKRRRKVQEKLDLDETCSNDNFDIVVSTNETNLVELKIDPNKNRLQSNFKHESSDIADDMSKCKQSEDYITEMLSKANRPACVQEEFELDGTWSDDQFDIDVDANRTNSVESKVDSNKDNINQFKSNSNHSSTESATSMMKSKKTTQSLSRMVSGVNYLNLVQSESDFNGTLKDEQMDIDASINVNKTEIKTYTTENNGSEFSDDYITDMLSKVNRLTNVQEEFDLDGTWTDNQCDIDVDTNITNSVESKIDSNKDNINQFMSNSNHNSTESATSMMKSKKTTQSLSRMVSGVNYLNLVQSESDFNGTLKDEQMDIDASINVNKTEIKTYTTENNGSEFSDDYITDMLSKVNRLTNVQEEFDLDGTWTDNQCDIDVDTNITNSVESKIDSNKDNINQFMSNSNHNSTESATSMMKSKKTTQSLSRMVSGVNYLNLVQSESDFNGTLKDEQKDIDASINVNKTEIKTYTTENNGSEFSDDYITDMLSKVNRLTNVQEEFNLDGTWTDDQCDIDVDTNITNSVELKIDSNKDHINQFRSNSNHDSTESATGTMKSKKTTQSLSRMLSGVNYLSHVQSELDFNGTLKDEQMDIDASINVNKIEMKTYTTENNGSEFRSSSKHKLHDDGNDIVKCKKIKASCCKDIAQCSLNKDDAREIEMNSVETVGEDI